MRPSMRRARAHTAFTLFELMVVVTIILILVVITVPSFARFIQSNNYASAVNQVTATLSAARERARSRGVETAVAFLFDVAEERYTLIVLEARGDGALAREPLVNNGSFDAAIFVPAQNTTPVTLPQGTAVFGLSLTHLAPDGWRTGAGGVGPPFSYQDSVVSVNDDQGTDQRRVGWYTGSVIADPDLTGRIVNTWIFPRSDPRLFLDPEVDLGDEVDDASEVELADLWRRINVASPGGAGAPYDVSSFSEDAVVRAIINAHSFMVRFTPEGSIQVAQGDTGQVDQTGFGYIEYPNNPVAAGETLPQAVRGLPFDVPTLFDPESATINPETGERFTADEVEPNPEVVLASVSRLAVVDLSELADGTGVQAPWRLHPTIRDPAAMDRAPWPLRYRTGDNELIDVTDDRLDELTLRVSEWIDENAIILDFNRYSGQVAGR